MNGISTKLTREAKIEQSSQLINHYDVDMKAALELGINWRIFPRSESLASFYNAEVDLRSVACHNRHKNPPTQHQQGGTALLAVNEISEYCKKSGSD